MVEGRALLRNNRRVSHPVTWEVASEGLKWVPLTDVVPQVMLERKAVS